MQFNSKIAATTMALLALSLLSCTEEDKSGSGPAPVQLTATLTAPTDGATVAELVDITVDAEDDKGVAKVEFYVNAIRIGEDAVSPYRLTWDASSLDHGSIHSIYAIAYDTDDNKYGTAPITCSIDTTLSLPQSPTIFAPTDITASSVTLSWSQSADNDFDHYIVKWGPTSKLFSEFDTLRVLIQSDTSISITGLQDNGLHHFQVATVDMFGNTSPSVSVEAPTVNIAPPQLNIEALVRSGGNLSVTWKLTEILDFTKYELIVSSDSVFDTTDAVLASITNILDTALTISYTNPDILTFFLVLHDHSGLSTASSGFLSDPTVINYALSFNGNQYATVPHFSALDVGDQYTLEAWVNMTSSATYMRVIDKGPPGASSPYLQYSLICDPRPGADICNGVAGPARYHSTGSVPINEWHHVALTYDNGTIIYYIDGAIVDSSETGISQSCAFSTTLNIGRRKMFDEFYFNGTMDDVRIWDVVRTPAEMSSNFNRRLIGNELGLVCYYDFNEGTGDIILSPVGGNGHLGASSGTDSNDPTWVVSTAPISN